KAVLNGWGVRPYNWEFSTSVQHEIVPRASVTVGYYRRIYGNFMVLDNEALGVNDFLPFSVTIPNDPRIPGAGTTLDGFYDQKATVVNKNVVKAASNFGNQFQHFNGIDIALDARLGNGIFLQGGVGTGTMRSDNCEIIKQVPEALQWPPITGVLPAGVPTPVVGQPALANSGIVAGSWTPVGYCHQESPFLTQVKALGSYQL